jgi:uncharacterized protein (DUF2147 family)
MKKLSLCMVLVMAPFAAGAAELKGKWLTDEGKGHVLFESCGSKMCGKIVWLKEPNDESGKPHVDALNENKSLRNRPIMGLRLTELESDGNGGWQGVIYNPEDGKSYKAKAAIQKDGSLLVKGCIMGGLLCDDQTWTRVN